MMDQFLSGSAGLLIGRLLVGGLLLLAGLLKYKAGVQWFWHHILDYKLVKGRLAYLLARGLPGIEMLCGVLLLLGLFTPFVVVITFMLLWGFTAAISSTFWRGQPVDCGCFGTTHRKNHFRWQLAYRNLVLMGLTIIIFNLGPGWLAVDSWLQERPHRLTTKGAISNGLVTIWLITLLAVASLHLITWRKRSYKVRNLT